MDFGDLGANHGIIDAGQGTGGVPSATICFIWVTKIKIKNNNKKPFPFSRVSSKISICPGNTLSSVPLVLITGIKQRIRAGYILRDWQLSPGTG